MQPTPITPSSQAPEALTIKQEALKAWEGSLSKIFSNTALSLFLDEQFESSLHELMSNLREQQQQFNSVHAFTLYWTSFFGFFNSHQPLWFRKNLLKQTCCAIFTNKLGAECSTAFYSQLKVNKANPAIYSCYFENPLTLSLLLDGKWTQLGELLEKQPHLTHIELQFLILVKLRLHCSVDKIASAFFKKEMEQASFRHLVSNPSEFLKLIKPGDSLFANHYPLIVSTIFHGNKFIIPSAFFDPLTCVLSWPMNNHLIKQTAPLLPQPQPKNGLKASRVLFTDSAIHVPPNPRAYINFEDRFKPWVEKFKGVLKLLQTAEEIDQLVKQLYEDELVPIEFQLLDNPHKQQLLCRYYSTNFWQPLLQNSGALTIQETLNFYNNIRHCLNSLFQRDHESIFTAIFVEEAIKLTKSAFLITAEYNKDAVYSLWRLNYSNCRRCFYPIPKNKLEWQLWLIGKIGSLRGFVYESSFAKNEKTWLKQYLSEEEKSKLLSNQFEKKETFDFFQKSGFKEKYPLVYQFLAIQSWHFDLVEGLDPSLIAVWAFNLQKKFNKQDSLWAVLESIIHLMHSNANGYNLIVSTKTEPYPRKKEKVPASQAKKQPAQTGSTKKRKKLPEKEKEPSTSTLDTEAADIILSLGGKRQKIEHIDKPTNIDSPSSPADSASNQKEFLKESQEKAQLHQMSTLLTAIFQENDTLQQARAGASVAATQKNKTEALFESHQEIQIVFDAQPSEPSESSTSSNPAVLDPLSTTSSGLTVEDVKRREQQLLKKLIDRQAECQEIEEKPFDLRNPGESARDLLFLLSFKSDDKKSYVGTFRSYFRRINPSLDALMARTPDQAQVDYLYANFEKFWRIVVDNLLQQRKCHHYLNALVEALPHLHQTRIGFTTFLATCLPALLKRGYFLPPSCSLSGNHETEIFLEICVPFFSFKWQEVASLLMEHALVRKKEKNLLSDSQFLQIWLIAIIMQNPEEWRELSTEEKKAKIRKFPLEFPPLLPDGGKQIVDFIMGTIPREKIPLFTQRFSLIASFYKHILAFDTVHQNIAFSENTAFSPLLGTLWLALAEARYRYINATAQADYCKSAIDLITKGDDSLFDPHVNNRSKGKKVALIYPFDWKN